MTSGKPFRKRAVRVHLREAQVGQRRNLESPHDLVATHSTRAEFFQESDGFSGCHSGDDAQRPRMVTREKNSQPERASACDRATNSGMVDRWLCSSQSICYMPD
jgi:hypothetical protein